MDNTIQGDRRTGVSRRQFLAMSAGVCLTEVASRLSADEPGSKTILLRSGWQTENIGDIAHTAGVLRLLREHLPRHRVILWGKALDRGVEPMLQRRFPEVSIVRGVIDPQKGPDGEDLQAAVEQADLLLHGSGPSLVAARDVEAWLEFTGKPWGALGITTQDPTEGTRRILNRAAFLFTRETTSLDHLEAAGVRWPHRAFAPDGTFAIDLRDEPRAEEFLRRHQLLPGQFLCVIPRLRVTPYYQFKPGVTWTEDRIRSVTELNAQWAEPDHAKAREAIIRWVRETGQKVLVCPEMTYQIEIGRPLLIDPLPDDVKSHVVHRDTYWLPDEAGSVYRRASAVLSFECHSPIIAFAHGRPAIYLRQPQDTIKGQMWYDIGVQPWVFEIEQSTGEEIAARVMEIHDDPEAARARLQQAMSGVRQRYVEALAHIDGVLENA